MPSEGASGKRTVLDRARKDRVPLLARVRDGGGRAKLYAARSLRALRPSQPVYADDLCVPSGRRKTPEVLDHEEIGGWQHGPPGASHAPFNAMEYVRL